MSIPLSALLGIFVGGIICIAIYYANHRLKSTVGLTVFTVALMLFLSTGLFSGGCHKFEETYGSTTIVWSLEGDFWDVNRLPMTIFKPFGYSDTRTVLQMTSFWTWMVFSLLLHYRKWKRCRKISQDEVRTNESVESLVELPPTEESIIDDEEEDIHEHTSTGSVTSEDNAV